MLSNVNWLWWLPQYPDFASVESELALLTIFSHVYIFDPHLFV